MAFAALGKPFLAAIDIFILASGNFKNHCLTPGAPEKPKRGAMCIHAFELTIFLSSTSTFLSSASSLVFSLPRLVACGRDSTASPYASASKRQLLIGSRLCRRLSLCPAVPWLIRPGTWKTGALLPRGCASRPFGCFLVGYPTMKCGLMA